MVGFRIFEDTGNSIFIWIKCEVYEKEWPGVTNDFLASASKDMGVPFTESTLC